MIFQSYGYMKYIKDISVDILKKNIGKPKIDQNLWKYKKNLIQI